MARSKQILEEAAHAKRIEEDIKRDAVEASLRARLAALEAKNKAYAAENLSLRDELARQLDLENNQRGTKFKKLCGKGGGDSTALVVLNDWHAEETVEADTVNGLNAFNLEIAAQRIARTFQKIPELLEGLGGFFNGINRQLVLALLGDLITGYIHPELEENNQLSPSEASLFVHDQLSAGIDFLLKTKCVTSIIAPTCDGNHGRTTVKPRRATRHKNSYEWLLYHHLAKQYRHEPRIAFKIEKGIHNWLDVQGHAVRFQHGDAIKYQGGVGGISIPVNKAVAQWNIARRAALDVFGHWHQSIQTDHWVCCNCLIGYSAHAQFIKAQFERPAQTLIVMSREHGKVLAMNIHCE